MRKVIGTITFAFIVLGVLATAAAAYVSFSASISSVFVYRYTGRVSVHAYARFHDCGVPG